jgi:hypothetical protein
VWAGALRLWSWLLVDEASTDEVMWVAAQLRSLPVSYFTDLAHVAVKRAHALPKVGSSCHEPAMRALQLARDNVGPRSPGGRKLLVSCWAPLVAEGGSAEELEVLLQEAQAVQAESEVVTALATSLHCLTALSWFSALPTCTQAPRSGLSLLVTLSANAVEKGEPLARILENFERHSDSSKCVDFVAKLDGPHALRTGLRWLTPKFPRAAVNLYPALLRFEPPDTADVECLLEVCAAHGLGLPILPQSATHASLHLLLASNMPEARAQACSVAPEKLLDDPNFMVRTVARAAQQARVAAAS